MPHPTPTLAEALTRGPVILDGGLATQLEAQGHDLSSSLWSARLLRDDPQAIVTAHREFYAAGAQVATTASYQATYEGFARAGLTSADTTELLRLSVTLAQHAREQHEQHEQNETATRGTSGPLYVAGSVGPYGAMLAGGEEYTGDYHLTVKQLRAFHRPRIEVLLEAGVDVLAIETIPQLAEVEALLQEIDQLGAPAWLAVSMTDDRLRSGEGVTEVWSMAHDVDALVAVGVNCSLPADAGAAIPPAAAESQKPVVIYPNSGEGWDAEARAWVGSPGFDPDDVVRWFDDGARLIGGCCRVRPKDIGQIADIVHGLG
ncbi:MAG: homocysteine S-methyltransferase [Actinomycetes bacterium]